MENTNKCSLIFRIDVMQLHKATDKNHTHREEFRKLKSVNLDISSLIEGKSKAGKGFDIFLDKFVLFRRDWTGYYNDINANRRLISSFVTTFWLFLIFSTLTFLFSYLGYKLEALLPIKLGSPGDGSLYSERLLTISFRSIAVTSIFFLGTWVGLFWREKSSMYKKWNYLAEL